MKDYKSAGCVMLSCLVVFFFAFPALDTIKSPSTRAYWEKQVDRVLEISPAPSQAIVAQAPAFALPSPQASSPPADQTPAAQSGGGGAPTGGGAPQPPACSPQLPSSVTATGSGALGSSGGTYQTTAKQVSATASGFTACYPNHLLLSIFDDHGAYSCVPGTKSPVSTATITIVNPGSQTIHVTARFGPTCPQIPA